MQVEFYLAGEITQVIDSIPWVRCASGNVFNFVDIPAIELQVLMSCASGKYCLIFLAIRKEALRAKLTFYKKK